MTTQDIREHMEVLGQDGRHVGTVDKVEGDRIKLTKKDSEAGGKHHYIMVDVVSHVDAHVHLMIPADQAMREWETDQSDAGDNQSAMNSMSDAAAEGDQPA